ncbi:MAG TPA: putative lipid II flippase FtsW, partial [Candidatus Avidesulfovibrio excrementigallinarum]|nr:putative lipid II flippase FtsW [Candidatus Avidesulfovibrio excrementigallinarum]
LGLLMVFSASGAVAERMYSDKYHFFKRQCLFVLMGGVSAFIVAGLPRDLLYKLQYPLLFAVFVLLVLTVSPLGLKIKGASRWISFGVFSLQPLEFAKIALALYLAYFMSAKQELVKTFSKGVLPPFLVTITLCALLLMQPDFGGAVLLAAILLLMCWVGGTRFVYLFIAIGMGLASVVALILHSPYRLRRLTAFLDPFKDAQDTGYQLVQSLYALGSGGLFGSGLGGGVQKMLYLPEAHTDFIMSVIGEELGFLGLSVTLMLFSLLFVRCGKIIMNQTDLRDKLSAFGITAVLSLGTLFNLAVVLGMAPPKGVAMPFLSYGGSSLLASMICVGLLLNFSRTAREL